MMWKRQSLIVLVLTFLIGGCNKERPDNPATTATPLGARRVFLDAKKEVGPRLEWSRDITSKRGGEIGLRVVSQGPIVVTVLNDRAYKALMAKDMASFRKEDVFLMVTSKEPIYEGRVSLPPGPAWIMIKNDTGEKATIHLQCSAD